MEHATGSAILDLWCLDPSVSFLNHGSFGACPRAVLDAQTAWRERMERRPVRFLAGDLPALLAEQVERLAPLIGADPHRVVFVENATQAVNAVLRSLPIGPGDEIVLTQHVYGAVRQAVRFVAERTGAVVIVAQVPFPTSAPEQVTAAIGSALTERTRLVVVDHLTSPTALVFPVEDVVAACRARRVPVLVDGAHAPGQLPLDLGALGADWYTGNLHKWLFAPKGSAFLYAAPGAEPIHPTVISHELGGGFREEFHWVGTKDPTAWLAVGAALDFVEQRGGWAGMMDHNRSLARRAADRLTEALDLTSTGPWCMRANLVTFPLPSGVAAPITIEGARRVHDLLEDRGVEVPVFPFQGRLWFRISAQLYNDLVDYDRLIDAFRSLRA